MKKETDRGEIERRIAALKDELGRVKGRKTEVYSRIVGYYRSVNNWNRGKREEYRFRKSYAYPTALPAAAPERSDGSAVAPLRGETGMGAVATYQYFYRTTCPNCPPVKRYLEALGFAGSEINVDHEEGFELAGDLAISATPTVIFRDREGNELLRTLNLKELSEAFEARQAVS